MAHSASLKRGCHRDVLDCVRDAFAEASGENALTSSVQDDWQEFIADEVTDNIDVLADTHDLIFQLAEHLESFGIEDVVFLCETLCDGLTKAGLIATVEEDESVNEEDLEEDSDNDGEEQVYRQGECALCDREMPLTAHHVIPKKMHKKWRKKGFDKKTLSHTVPLCRPCHSACHKYVSHEEMAEYYHTIDRLLEVDQICRWVKYASKQKTYNRSHGALQLRYKK